MNEKLIHLCMGEKETMDFLERTLKAKNIVNELSGLAQSARLNKQFSSVYITLSEILSPLCSDCKVRAQKFITSPAELFDPDMANYPGGTSRSWTGEWFCPECRRIVAYEETWWRSPTSGREP